MSLRVWLPLNGNLNNQGLSDITVTNNGATVDNNGKIGKCYYFDGNAHYLQFSESVGDLYSGDFSYAVWLKPMDDTRSVICSEYASSGASNIAFELSASRQVRLYWNGSPDISSTGCILPKSQWTHIAITRSGNEAKFYMNGELKYTYTGTLSNRTSTAKIRLGDDYRGGTSVSYMGYINDFRIYDHALSPKEVEILSRGLVCHYPLSDIAVETTTNLVTSISAGGQTTVNGDMVTTSGKNKDTFFTLNLSENISVGTQYTISCDVSGVPSDQHWLFPLGTQGNTSLIWGLKNGHNEYTFTANNIDWGTKRLFMDDTSRTFYGITTFSHFQLEKKDHATLYAGLGGTRSGDLIVYDCSGYKNNGTINGSLTVSTDTARYNVSTKFNGNNYILLTSPCAEIKTISFWAKWDSIPSGQSILFLDYKSKTGFGLAVNGIICSSNGVTSYTFNKSNLVANTWYHFTIVCPNGGSNALRKLYINGVEQTATSNQNVWTYAIDQLQIGKRSTSSDGFVGKMSDFRAYAIALSAAQVAELYNTAVSVANNGTLMGYELVEV